MSCNKLTYLVSLAEESERISLRGTIPDKKEQLISQMKEELEESGMSFEEMKQPIISKLLKEGEENE